MPKANRYFLPNRIWHIILKELKEVGSCQSPTPVEFASRITRGPIGRHIECLGIWKQLNNSGFKSLEFEGFKTKTSLNSVGRLRTT